MYSKTATLKRPKIGFQDQLSLNAGQKYCRMLPFEHFAILSPFMKLPFVIKIFVLSILSAHLTQVLKSGLPSFLLRYLTGETTVLVFLKHIAEYFLCCFDIPYNSAISRAKDTY